MNVPFTAQQFMQVLVDYNRAIWPLQFGLISLALAAIALAWRENRVRSHLVAGILGVFWLWMGIAYHWVQFTTINPAAWIFGGLFVLEGALFLYEGLIRRRLRISLTASRDRWLAAGLLLYALVIYPLLGHLLGHRYPQAPTFGLPCPTTIFTFGLLLALSGRVPRRLLVIPALWSVVGFFAALKFGVYEDVGLLVAGLAASPILVLRSSRRGPPLSRPAVSS